MTQSPASALLRTKKQQKELKSMQPKPQSGNVYLTMKYIIRFWEVFVITAGFLLRLRLLINLRLIFNSRLQRIES